MKYTTAISLDDVAQALYDKANEEFKMKSCELEKSYEWGLVEGESGEEVLIVYMTYEKSAP